MVFIVKKQVTCSRIGQKYILNTYENTVFATIVHIHDPDFLCLATCQYQGDLHG